MRPRAPDGLRGRLPAPPPGRWLIALPAWGDRCVRVLIQYTLPALLEALKALDRPAVLMIWTDQPDRVGRVLRHSEGDEPAVIAAPPGPDGAFESLSNCHRQAMEAARAGDRVLLLTADMVVSREVLATCERHVAGGARLVCCCAMRAREDAFPPVGASGRELLEWAWANRHPMTADCTWPDGRSYDVWRMYFEQGDEVAARVFLPHPLVVVPAGRVIHFAPTIDVNLTMNFEQSVTHMITRPEEGAVVEVSPADKEYLKTTTMRERMIDIQHSCPPLIRCSNPRHRMFWEKKVIIRGAGGDCGDGELVGRVLG